MKRKAPCKINLALDILGRRPDGYHEMDMIMQTVSLWDCVTVRPASAGFAIHTGGDLIPAGKKSLEQRAAESFFSHVGREMPGLCVELEKHTPAYAGLGGGSADVAALLRILRDTYAPDLRDETLEAIGLEIGSDMPFCVRGYGAGPGPGRAADGLAAAAAVLDCTVQAVLRHSHAGAVCPGGRTEAHPAAGPCRNAGGSGAGRPGGHSGPAL